MKRPDILLLDEPLSNLDARLRHEMRGEIKRLQKEVGITSIFVTHDQLEALTMADRVAVMRDGRLQAYATPAELYSRPANRFVARAQDIELPLPPAQRPRADTGANAMIGIRPEHIALVPPGEGHAAGEVYVVEPVGREQIVDVQVGGRVLRVVAPPGYGGKMGDRIGLRFALDHLHLFDPQSGDRLA